MCLIEQPGIQSESFGGQRETNRKQLKKRPIGGASAYLSPVREARRCPLWPTVCPSDCPTAVESGCLSGCRGFIDAPLQGEEVGWRGRERLQKDGLQRNEHRTPTPGSENAVWTRQTDSDHDAESLACQNFLSFSTNCDVLRRIPRHWWTGSVLRESESAPSGLFVSSSLFFQLTCLTLGSHTHLFCPPPLKRHFRTFL